MPQKIERPPWCWISHLVVSRQLCKAAAPQITSSWMLPSDKQKENSTTTSYGLRSPFFSPQMFCVWVKTVRYDSSFTDTNRYRRFRRGVLVYSFFFQNRGVRVKINHVLEWTRYYYVPSCPSSLVCIRTLHRLKSTFVSSAFTYKWTASKYRSWIIALSPLERYLAIFYCS